MVKKLISIIMFASVLLLFGTSALADYSIANVSESAPSEEVSEVRETGLDMAKIYLTKHRMTIGFGDNKTEALLDGVSVQTDPAITRGGSSYISLRTLKLSGAAAEVSWNTGKQEAKVLMKRELSPAWQELILRTGSSQAFRADGKALPNVKLPEPLLDGGRVYIPVKSLALLGIAASVDEGQLVLEWSEKFIELNKWQWETGESQATFSVLYQQEMYSPQIMVSYGSGAWGGGTGKPAGNGIALDGRVYSRMEYTVDLRPGVNPLRLYAISAGMADFSITRKVEDPGQIALSFTEQGARYVTFTAPDTGYVKLKAGESLNLAGMIKQDDPALDNMTLIQQRYELNGDTGKQGYKTTMTETLPISESKFDGKVSFDEPGHYLLQVYSPRYVPMPEAGPASVLWAEFVVEIE